MSLELEPCGDHEWRLSHKKCEDEISEYYEYRCIHCGVPMTVKVGKE